MTYLFLDSLGNFKRSKRRRADAGPSRAESGTKEEDVLAGGSLESSALSAPSRKLRRE